MYCEQAHPRLLGTQQRGGEKGGMGRDSCDITHQVLSVPSRSVTAQRAPGAGSPWRIGGRVQRLRRLNKPLLSLGWKCNLRTRSGYGRLSKICSRYGNLMHLVETNCRSSVFIGIVQTCSVMNWSGKTLAKIKKKNNPRSGFVVGIIEIRANTTLQVLVCSSPVISAAVLLM